VTLLIVGGATATGKTAFAEKLARLLNSSVISADSTQIYKGLDIGSAKEKQPSVRTYCVDIIEPSMQFSVVDYRREASDAIAKTEADGKIPIVAGGSGYYISSLLYDYDYGGEEDGKIKEELETALCERGPAPLYERLKNLDPDGAAKIHPNNTKRLLRALSVTLSTGRPFSKQNENRAVKPYKMYVLKAPSRENLYKRIDDRVDSIFGLGLRDEVRALLSKGLTFENQSMRAIGYKEWKGYFEGKLSLGETAELIKKNTRAYAKRQETWFKHQYEGATYVDITSDLNKMAEEIAHSILK
jgi:tRNA dimethylallyltransferase